MRLQLAAALRVGRMGEAVSADQCSVCQCQDMNDCVGLWTEDEQCAWAAGYVMDNWRAGEHFSFNIKCIVMWRVTYFSCCLITPSFSDELYVSMFKEVYIPLLEHLITQNMKRDDQQGATIRCLLLTSVLTCFGHHYTHLQENKGPVTAFGVLF